MDRFSFHAKNAKERKDRKGLCWKYGNQGIRK